MNPRRLALLACAALLVAATVGCTRETSVPAPSPDTGATPGATTGATPSAEATGTPATSASSTPPAGAARTPSPTPPPSYVEVATGSTSTTPPDAEFPTRTTFPAQLEVDRTELPPTGLRGRTDPTGRYLAYLDWGSGQPEGFVRDRTSGKEWKLGIVVACQCDASAVDPGPVWSPSGRFVAFGTGTLGVPAERRVVVVEPSADRVTELPKPAWMRHNFLGEASVWRPGYDLLAVSGTDGVYLYDAVAGTTTLMAVGRWPRFVTRDLVQYDLLGADGRPDRMAFTDIWRGGEVARLPYVPWLPLTDLRYEDGKLALAAESFGPACIGLTVAHPALAAPSLCIPGAHMPAWSPDGRILAFSRADGPTARSVVLFDPATGTQRPIAERLPASYEPEQYESTWSADGRYLRFAPSAIVTGP
ncbi:MAG: hypothetical protein AB7G21_00680 [Dehalococcoidia bacterium]